MLTTTLDLNPALVPWPIVTPSDEKKLVALAVPYVRWLNRDLIAGLVQDNEKHQASWEKVFAAADVLTDLYLWSGSACTYPGIRRKTGKNEQTGGVGIQSLQLDSSGNHMAHRVWELLGTTKSGFKIDRKGYELVHLFPHKAAEWKKLLKILAAFPGVTPISAEWQTHLSSQTKCIWLGGEQ